MNIAHIPADIPETTGVHLRVGACNSDLAYIRYDPDV